MKPNCWATRADIGKQLADRDQLALLHGIVSRVSGQASSRKTASLLLRVFGSLAGVMRASYPDICAVEGIIPETAQELVNTGLLLQSITRSELSQRPALANLDAVLRYCRGILAGEKKEQFHALFLNKSLHTIAHECIQVGTVDHVTVYPRELMQRALHHYASALILVHNHPSGNSKPSKGDIAMTRKLEQIGNFLGISIVDHIIISAQEEFSFRSAALITDRTITTANEVPV